MQTLDSVRDVFFDLDHTLWDFEKNSALAFATIFSDLGIGVDLEAYLEVYVPINHDYWEKYRKDEISHEELRFGRFRKAFDVLGFAVSDEDVAKVSAEYIRCLPQNNHLFDGTLEILDYLESKYALHIITNGFDEVQRLKIENSGLGRYFKTVTNSEMAGAKKPNPVIFEHAVTLANADRKHSVMIGDCIDADVRGALNYGMGAILFCPDADATHEGVTKISNLIELKKYL
jgi:putative hydrolase of the HAD superfamily